MHEKEIKQQGGDAMRWLGRICLLVLAPGLVWAQTSTQNTGSTDVAAELQKLRDAVALQQQTMTQQQEQMAQQQRQIEALQKALEEKPSGTAHVENASLSTNVPNNANAVQGDEKPKESPLSFRIGGTEFTPGGFVDFENVFRSTNTGNNISTSFGAIPFSNTVQGHLTEFRTTGQYSRYNLKITGKYGANNITGYLEGDFNGNDAANVFVTSNPHTNRLRLYWMDLKRGNWEFLGGQSWGWVTPNRVGLSPMPADLAITINEDANIQVGIPYTRAGTFRAIYHFNDNFQWGVAVENPEQFVGAGEVIFPFAFNAQLGPQFDAANNTATPNLGPDLWTKMAWDGNPGGRHMHFELGGVMTTAKATFLPIVTPPPSGGVTFQHSTKVGGGIVAATNIGLSKNFRFLANGLWGNGVGRYIIGLGPQVVVRPIDFNGGSCLTGNCGVKVSGVHSGTALAGFEWQAAPKTLFGWYYGGAYFQRNAFQDLTSPLVVKPFIGFGGLNSPNSANRAIQEATMDWTQTFWRNPQYGAVLMVTQYSYLTRAPWFVALGAPKNAHLSMGWLSIRYVLP
jgi:hypothetical protein